LVFMLAMHTPPHEEANMPELNIFVIHDIFYEKIVFEICKKYITKCMSLPH
jgi:hypothetical protein